MTDFPALWPAGRGAAIDLLWGAGGHRSGWCRRPGDGTLLTLTGNYLNLGTHQALYEDGGYVDGGGNTFIGTCNPSSAC